MRCSNTTSMTSFKPRQHLGEDLEKQPLPGEEAEVEEVEEPTYHYNGPAGKGQHSLSTIVDFIQDNPEAKHYVWQRGWKGWKPAQKEHHQFPQ